jgi:Rrf2 family transcriptional regulator, cysteine metabolism repressor
VKLSVKVNYACRVLAQIARLHGTAQLAHVESLAQAESAPANYLAQILSELRDGGLITSRRGKQGGYALARAPEKISLLDIVKLVEGEVLEINNDSRGESSKRLQQVWAEVNKAMEEKLSTYTLDKLVSKNHDEMYYI